MTSTQVGPGDVAVLDIYVRDVPGSCIDTENNDGFAGFSLQLGFDPALIDALELEQVGATDSPMFLFGINGDLDANPSILALSNGLFNIELGANAPGTLFTRLKVTPSAAAVGQTITFTSLGQTSMTNGSGTLEIRESDNTLEVNLGSIDVVAGGAPPVINNFTVAPSIIETGQSAQLSWDVSNVDQVTITNVGTRGATGQQSVSPSSTTVYRLTATNDFGTEFRDVQLTVTQPGGDPPVINSFSVAPGSIDPGGSATLSWNVSDADTISIDPIGAVAATGSQSVSPSQTTNYLLTATNSFGTNTAQALLVVTGGNDPVINTFTASAQEVVAGDQVVLTWDVENSDEVTITPDVGFVPRSSAARVRPTEDTTYTLVATNNSGGGATQSIFIEVAPRLEIVSFTASATQIAPGEDVQLSWEVLNATGLSLTGFAGNQPLTGSATVSPTETTNYVLNASGGFNQLASDAIEIQVIAPSISTDTDLVDLGEDAASGSVTLSKNTSDAVNWSLQGLPEWLEANPASGAFSNSTDISFTVNRDYFFPGLAREAAVTIAADGFDELTVTVQAASAGEGTRTVRYFPLIEASDRVADLVLANHGDDALAVLVQAFDQQGDLQDVQQIDLPARGSHTVSYMDFDGWAVASTVLIEGAEAPLEALINNRALDDQELYTLSAVKRAAPEILIPHIAKDPQFQTRASAVNLSNDAAGLNFSSSGLDDIPLPFLDEGNAGVFDFAQDIFMGDILGQGWGAFDFGAPERMLAGVEVFGFTEVVDKRQLVGVSLSPETNPELLFVHIAADTLTFWTGIVVLNPNEESAQVNVQPYDADGAVLEPLTLEIPAGEKVTWAVTQTNHPFGEAAAWLRVTADRPITGYELFGTNGDGSNPDLPDQWAGFEAVLETGTRLLFPHLEEGRGDAHFTGVALVNPNDDTLNLTLRLFSAEGTLKETTTDTLLPFQKKASGVAGLFTAVIEPGDTVHIDGDHPFAGFQIYGFSNRTLGAILAPIND